MADELIERVALAMYAALEGFSSEAVAADYWRCNDENDNAARTNNRYRRAAAAVIRTLLRAMETPSETVQAAGGIAEPFLTRPDEPPWRSGRIVAATVWCEMLKQFAREHGVEMEGRDG